MNDTYDEFSDVLGAYALDAIDDDERLEIEAHLAVCPRCRAEVAEHREVASLLSQSGASAPEGIWDRIASELSPPAPPLRVTIAPATDVDADGPAASTYERADDATVASLDRARARTTRRSRTMLGLLAAAACIVAVLAVVTVGQSQRLNRLEDAMSRQSVESLANDAVGSSKVRVDLDGPAGTAEAVVGESGQGYLIMGDVPAPASGDVYQLWGKVDDTILSLGTFGDGSSVVPFSVDPDRIDDIELFAVTQERAPGVVASKNDPVMAGTV